MTAYRSFLFTPGNHPRRVEKVFVSGADAAILDLEDAVAVTEKPAARAAVVAALQRPRNCGGYVRVNAMDTPFAYGDFAAVVGPGIDGIILPKVNAGWQLKAADWLLSELERQAGLPIGKIDLIPIIETGEGMANLQRIAQSRTRTRRMAFGAGDFTLDVGMAWTTDESELDPYRAQMVVQSRAAGLEAPLDTVWVELSNAEGLDASAQRAARIGFQGKMCIHPNQIDTVNRRFTPSATEIARAEKIMAAFDRAEAEGSASIQVDGAFVDYPIVAKARRVLDLVRQINGIGSGPTGGASLAE